MSKCKKCSKAFEENSVDCINCGMCEEWFHTKCTELKSEHVTVLGKYESCYWYCKTCLPSLKSQSKPNAKHIEGKIETVRSQQATQSKVIAEIKAEVSKIHSTVIPILKSLESSRENIPSHISQQVTQPKAKPLVRPPPPKPSPTESPRVNVKSADNNHIVIIENVTMKEAVKSNSAIKREISNHYPRVKIKQALALANGSVFLHLEDAATAQTMIDSWKSKCLGEDTRARRSKTIANRVIIKNCDEEGTDERITALLQNDYPNCSFQRFVKKDGTVLKTAFITMPDKPSFSKSLKDGFFLGNRHYSAEEYFEKPRAIRCFNCQKLGHSAKLCNRETKCSRCGENGHSSDNCDDSKEIKCANCNHCHVSYSSNCPVYRETSQTVQTPPARDPAMVE